MKSKISIKIDSKRITIIEGKYENKFVKVSKYVVIETPKDSLENGGIKDVQLLSNAISKVLKDNKFKAKEVIFIINTGSVISRVLKLPYVDNANDVLSMIKFELEQSMPIDLSQYNFIYKVINRYVEQSVEKAEYVVHGLQSYICEGYTKLADELKLTVSAMDLSFNNFEALNDNDVVINSKSNVRNKVVGFIDFGYDSTVFSVMNNGTNDFSRVIDKSFRTIQREFYDLYAMDESNLCTYLNNIDIMENHQSNCDEFDSPKFDILKNYIETSIDEINRYIKYYNSKNKGIGIDKIYIYGPYIVFKNFEKYLSSVLNIQVEVISELSNVNILNKKQADFDIKIYFENILSFNAGKNKLHFLSLQSTTHKANFGKLVVGIAVGVPCILFVAFILVKYIYDISLLQIETKSMTAFIEKKENIDVAQKVKELNVQIESMNSFKEILVDTNAQTSKSDLIDTQIFIDISDKLPKDSFLQSITLGIEEGKSLLYIQCVASELSSIAQFEKNIKDLKYINDAYISTINNGDSFSYVIICSLKDVNNNEAE